VIFLAQNYSFTTDKQRFKHYLTLNLANNGAITKQKELHLLPVLMFNINRESMKKVMFLAIAAVAVAFASCGNKADKAAGADSTAVDSVEVLAQEADAAAQESIGNISALLDGKDATALQTALETVKAKAAELLATNPELAKEYLTKVQTFLKENADKVKALVGDNATVNAAVTALTEAPAETVISGLSSALGSAQAAGADAATNVATTVENVKEAVKNAPEATKEAVNQAVEQGKAKANEKANEAVEQGKAQAAKKIDDAAAAAKKKLGL
jgi:hypothetical protein